jgi:hypothetical protein
MSTSTSQISRHSVLPSKPRAGVRFALPALLMTFITLAAPGTARAQLASGPLVINSVNLTNFQIVDNVLTATGTVTGTLGGLPFTTDIENFALQLIPDDPTTPGTECSVLDLHLGPINLALLGLHVDTSQICLELTATEGGGLLGDLLCGLAGGDLLGLGIPILPTAGEVADLEGALTDILNGTLSQAQPGQGGGGDVCMGETEILHLVVGPLDLSLLGLNVLLDNCEGGPVEVCVSATAGEGLLGNLLAGLANGPINLTIPELQQLGQAITSALADGTITGREAAQLRALAARLLR